MPVNSKTIPLGYTLMTDTNPVLLGSVIEFWDVSNVMTTLMGQLQAKEIVT